MPGAGSSEKGISRAIYEHHVGFEDWAWGLFELPVGSYFRRVDRKLGRLYVLPPYTDDRFLRRMSVWALLAVGAVALAVVLQVKTWADAWFIAALLLFAVVIIALVLWTPYGTRRMAITQQKVAVNRHQYFHRSFVQLDVYPEIAMRRERHSKGVSFDPFFNFVFTVDIGSQDVEEQVAVYCKERAVPAYIGELRSFLPALRAEFHRGYAPDGDTGFYRVFSALKGL